MLGVLAQESNLCQGARFAVPGVTANPLIGNYFGIDYYNDTPSDDWTIDWAEADCGYGIGQITDGMRKPGMGQPTLPYGLDCVLDGLAARLGRETGPTTPVRAARTEHRCRPRCRR